MKAPLTVEMRKHVPVAGKHPGTNITEGEIYSYPIVRENTRL
ncbi:hypothetical protein M2387_000887 [Klebsiella sp. BIGb0407]|nr:hypothetical protein [Klebsiella sp. BIGb0407]